LPLSFQPIKPLLQTGTNAASRWLSYIGLAIGVLLLLCSLQMFINIQHMLEGNVIRKNGFDFISVTKRVTNETMGNAELNVFSVKEIEQMKAQPFIDDAAPLLANEFHAQLSVIGIIRTDMFLESVRDEFIDTLPPSFSWQEGDANVPIILGSDFLEVYNVFSPGQGLPQLSRESAMRIPIVITCFGKGRRIDFNANVVAFSDRINSVLVPKNFLEWTNRHLGELKQPGASRVFIKTADANNPELVSFLESKNYYVNKEKVRFGKEKRILQGVFSGLGIFGILVVALALMLFSFYLQLLIARSRDSLQLLLLLGYSPRWLGKNVSRQFIPVYIFIVLTALILTQGIQWAFYHFYLKIFDRPELTPFVHWSILLLAAILVLLSVLANFRLVRKSLAKLREFN
jgi:hypothetical protein